jgi:[acyl-carrier-protein] S-malonyltransferase
MGQTFWPTEIGRQAYDIAVQTLGADLLRIMREGPAEELQQTVNAQPAILLVSVVAWRHLAAAGVRPNYLAGHSLGEYSAYAAAGSISLEDALRVVRLRGEAMQDACPQGQGMMAAILNLSNAQVEQACLAAAEQGVVAPANYNAPGQVVISGEREAVERAMQAAKELGAKRAIPLAVSGPFHSRLMLPAAQRMSETLAALPWQPPRVPVIANIDAAEVRDSERIVPALIQQISGAVRWEQSMRYLAEQGVDTFIECGPGRVLSGLIRKIVPGAACLQVEDLPSLEKSLSHLA